MSSVAFHSPGSTVRVGGAERAWAGALCDRITYGLLDVRNYTCGEDSSARRILRMVRADHYLHTMDLDRAAASIPAALGFSDDVLTWNGQDVDIFGVVLNTALVIGDDAVKFSARMHGSCELHAWAAGPNRTWLAQIIERGQQTGVFRQARQTHYENWPGVVRMLRESAADPVVMSYSVCESFPDPYIARPAAKPYKEMTEDEKITRDAEIESWYSLDRDLQWAEAFAALTSRGDGLELTPDRWQDFRFTHKLSALDLTAPDWTERLDRAFPRAA